MLAVLYGGACALSLAITSAILSLGERLQLLDKPNARSSHTVPKPRGGGVAFTFTFLAGLLVLWRTGMLAPAWAWPILIATVPVATVGLLDDLRSQSARLRFAVQLSTALALCYYLSSTFDASTGLWAFLVLSIVWLTNLYNLMDGIDGLAASHAMVVALWAAFICWLQGLFPLASLYGLLFFSVAGFLWFNWPPARIFMGDCGAYFLGSTFGCFALLGHIHGQQLLATHAILLGSFIADASYTVMVRLFREKGRIHQAHRTHGYQKLSARRGSHRPATLIWSGASLFWFGPWALLSAAYPGWATVILVVSYLPGVAFVAKLRAGVPQQQP